MYLARFDRQQFVERHFGEGHLSASPMAEWLWLGATGGSGRERLLGFELKSQVVQKASSNTNECGSRSPYGRHRSLAAL